MYKIEYTPRAVQSSEAISQIVDFKINVNEK